MTSRRRGNARQLLAPRRRGILVLPWLAAAALAGVVTWRVLAGGGGGERDAPPLEKSAPAAASGAGSATPPVPAAEVPAPQEEDRAAWRASVARVRAGADPVALWRELGRWALDEALATGEREEVWTALEGASGDVVFSRRALPGFREVKVRAGDSYWLIARRLLDEGLSVSAGLLELVNGIGASRLRAGQVLKVPEGPAALLVDKSELRLYLLLDGVPLRRWPVGTGRDDLTPEGAFEVRGKMKNPTWTDPKTGRVHRFGEEGHIIGTRWLGFHREGAPTGFGIHGTNDPSSVGSSVSDGCIRLRNEDVETVFDLVPEGATAFVRP